MATVDHDALRRSILNGTVNLDVTPLTVNEIEQISWSGSRAHLENVVQQLRRVESGEVEYLAGQATEGLPVAKGGTYFAKERGAATIWQVAIHPQLERLRLATRLMEELEARARRRGVRKVRLGVEIGNDRARQLYRTSATSRSTVCGFYRFAYIDGRICSNSAQYVRRPQVHPTDARGLDRSELGVFLFTAEQYDRDHTALAVLLGLNGLRVSEACATNIADLGFERGHRTLRIVGKGNKPATVPLVPRTARTIDLAVGERHEGPILRR